MTPAGSLSSARRFHELHQTGLLLLANAWDAGSARLIESLGFKAIATSSAAVAWAHGYADGDRLPVLLLAATVGAIARVIRVPLSVDIESGYSSDPVAVGAVVTTVIDAGAVGLNLEDGNGSVDLLCAKIEQAKRAGERTGVNVFVNARTDTYLRDAIPPAQRVAETLVRAERYRAAGADGIFVPGVTDRDSIRALTSGIRLPVNLLARASLPGAAELVAMGVRRLSAGSSISEALFARTAVLAADFLRTGLSAPLVETAMPYREINALMSSP